MDITVQELHQKIQRGDSFVFIDVREPHEFAEFNIGAQLIPLGSFPDNLPNLAEYKNEEVVVHCRSGARSASAQAFLQMSGFTKVRNLIGGVLAWKEAGY